MNGRRLVTGENLIFFVRGENEKKKMPIYLFSGADDGDKIDSLVVDGEAGVGPAQQGVVLRAGADDVLLGGAGVVPVQQRVLGEDDPLPDGEGEAGRAVDRVDLAVVRDAAADDVGGRCGY